MNKFRYRVFYEFKGKTHSDPFGRQKSPEEITRALENFVNDMEHSMPENPPAIQLIDSDHTSRRVEVATSLTKDATDLIVERCLKNLGLFGDLIP